MTKLERRITEVAEATGRNVYVGRKGHKEDWFAGSGDIEHDGPSALAALESVVDELRRRADKYAVDAMVAAKQAEAMRGL